MKLAIGSAQFGMLYGINNRVGQVSQQEVKLILKYASSVGINTIDTAISYGSSEKVLGYTGVERFRVVSKLPPIPNDIQNIENWMFVEINSSLKRLGISSLDAIMLHQPNQVFGPMGKKILSSFQAVKKSGLAKKLGVSIYDPADLDKLFNIYNFDIIQCPLNILDRRLVDSGWLVKLKSDGVEVHTRSSFLQGLLLMERNKIPAKFEIWKSYWDKWDEWIRDNNISRIRACLSYCLSCKGIDKIVVGVDKESQLREIVDIAESKILTTFPDISCTNIKLINPSKW